MQMVQRENVLAKESWLWCRVPERQPLGLECGWRGAPRVQLVEPVL